MPVTALMGRRVIQQIDAGALYLATCGPTSISLRCCVSFAPGGGNMGWVFVDIVWLFRAPGAPPTTEISILVPRGAGPEARRFVEEVLDTMGYEVWT